MPPRSLSRPLSAAGGAVQFPSPERPSSRLGGVRSLAFASGHPAPPSAFPSASAEPSASSYHPSTSAAAHNGVHYDSAVSESLSRAYFYDVVLEADSTSASIEPDQPGVLLPWLGSVIVDHNGATEDDQADEGIPRSGSGSSIHAISSDTDRRHHDPASLQPARFDMARFLGRVQELIDTEHNYIRRIETLHQKYSIPLRQFAKDRDTAIIPIYEAQRLFGNIGEIVGANRAFLIDLETLAARGGEAVRAGLGDLVYRHMSCFGCYTEYFANFEKAKHIERTLAKHRGFQEFAERTKYSTTGLGNVGLRDLLMEPIQRVPRYKLLLEGIVKHMDARDSQKGRLEDAVVLASRIASCEADDKTKRAAVLWSFSRTVEDFPASLISVHREFLDCIDVDDFPLEQLGAYAGPFSPGAAVAPSGKAIHCTLFLFDDRLAIVKRSSSTVCGRKVVGLDDLNRLADQMKMFTERSSTATPSGSKKGDLSFRGVVHIMDLEALDLGGTDLQINLLRPPSQTSGDKWIGRPVRQYVTVDTASLAGSVRGARSFDNDTPARLEKTRFLESIWRARALFKAKEHRSHVRCQILPAGRPPSSAEPDSEATADVEADEIAAREAEARRVVYWNVYTRRNYLSEPHKAPLAIHVNPYREADPLPFGPETAPPHAALEVTHIDDNYGECQTSTLNKLRPDRPSEVTVVGCSDLALRMAQLAAETGQLMRDQVPLYAISQPSTPSSHRTRVAAGLEQFGRNLLFGGGAVPIGFDAFGSPARRTKSNASKSTAYSSDVHSISSRAMTYSTAATSVSSRGGLLDGAMSVASHRHAEPSESGLLASPRKLMKKRRSSSVGPPSMATERSPIRAAAERMARTRGTTPEPGYLSTASAGVEDAEPYRARAASPFGLRSNRLGGYSGHQRAKTESLGMSQRSPLLDRGYEPGLDSYGHEVQPGTPSGAGPSTPTIPIRATTPLNIRRKPPPRAFEDDDDEVEADGGRSPAKHSDAYDPAAYGDAAPGRAQTPSGSRSKPQCEATPTSSRPKQRASHSDDAGGAAPGRPSLSESDASTERGDAVPVSPRKTDDREGRQAIPKRSTSVSRQRGVEEARKRSRAVEDSVRLLKEEVKRLRYDLGSGASDGDGAKAQRRRSVHTPVMHEVDLNLGANGTVCASADKLMELTTELEIRLASSIRMHERLLAQVVAGGGGSSSSSNNGGGSSEALEKQVASLRTQVAVLARKCELLTTLETDGRMENTELHKAFNEELDRMYEDTQRPESEELATLREEIKRVKRQRNEASVKNKKLHLDLEVERAQSSVYREILEANGLL
ncbi:hypothetical protein ACQY0O_001131 [Thecaphora frezii]